ncbi:L-glutamate gamma-semialdehyde dehydrogenase [Streptomonospora nanhaiensis]|uniref:L-glutamate gamma-semialdehyde dehydrogenase n=1 Tax=Streptomonospora nanhaiensis TaxID=1323731 RepID=A0A853BMX0_9ACTN|nr:L-glutamate gamma-semialdehyde dehydrogenase [Streptomonospora nanhaiensis]MBV2362116.1 L-glutamate gamma-semialdehyde dehydrogenase [Streptomonospora nanhaiensis]MBV2364812.1 L-glutamate gamma-semialdehyde dehydrogenase [Streptomonospora nanhaiensis]MBX9388569.1 L-glutamate gamma-semialdehyde dehydrogenase [Streptomonospora nanhaiensis]NYI96055.1 1-pyrroline-5-carboxylate dehydrogenase [Streptomonospora nanhaiensis]
MDAVTNVPEPVNEPNLSYAPGTPERAAVEAEIARLSAQEVDLGQTIGGETAPGAGEPIAAVQPHRHGRVLGRMTNATAAEVARAVDAARAAAPAWRAMPFDERAAVLLRAADLLAGPWRQTLNAATMLGQSKSVQQAEIDAACELIDFWRFNVAFARRLYTEQPISVRGVWNRQEFRPLEGFVLAITPFNFTAIAGNLPTAPALMGNTVVWKPSPTQTYSAYFLLRLLEEAGLPPGVVNLVTGDGAAVSEVALAQPDLAGIHFTGSTRTFQHLWRTVGHNIADYRSYPRIVGETGGKDFIVAHTSADPAVLRTAMIRGAFEYQGQKCSAASRAYVPRSVWRSLRDDLVAEVESLTMGDVTGDVSTFMGAVIDDRAFAKNAAALKRAADTDSITVLTGGGADDSEGYFVEPTVMECTDPEDDVFRTEYFGPLLAVHVYDDSRYDDVLAQMADVAPYALTGAVIARDRAAIARADAALRFSAGNFYVNDKPTGSIVGQQPFGGARASGTNDKAGSVFNLARWVSPRAVKETFAAPTDWRYPHMG